MSLIKYAFLVGATAMVVQWLPEYLASPPPIVIDGFVAEGFEDVKRVFRENFEQGFDSLAGGSAFSVYHHGVKVVDLWGGYADVEAMRVWRQNTLTNVKSSGKAVAAVCIAKLVDRGLLDYDQPVARYWPEFAQNGKEKITVGQLMEHKSGLFLAPPPGLSLDLLRDVSKAGELMAASEPQFAVDGVTHGYQGLTIGPMTNELLRRVDPKHRTMGQFLREEIRGPFGVDFFIGVPLEESHRAARFVLNTTPFYKRLILSLFRPEERRENWFVLNNDNLINTLVNGGTAGQFNRYNDPEMRTLEFSSASGYGSAESQAKLYGILAVGGTDPATNKTLLSRKLVTGFLAADPPSEDLVLGLPMTFRHGFMVEKPLDGVTMFGHVGAGGQLAFANPEHEIGFSFVSNFQMPVVAARDQRGRRLIEALFGCVKKLSK